MEVCRTRVTCGLKIGDSVTTAFGNPLAPKSIRTDAARPTSRSERREFDRGLYWLPLFWLELLRYFESTVSVLQEEGAWGSTPAPVGLLKSGTDQPLV